MRVLKLPPEALMGPSDFLSNAGSWLVAGLGSLAATAPEMVMDLFIFTIALYFFLTEAKSIRKTLSGMKILSEREWDSIILVIQKSSYNTLVVSAAVGAIQALIVSGGKSWFGP
jgi:predicted PurR-regulated permease PerM